YRPERKTEEKPEMYKIKNIEIVGGYAIQILWKDGHDTGIYSWEYIIKLVSSQDSGTSEEYNNLI
ncbi:MAG: DUF971 domain-containing protein, partial [Ignavibacteriaceae bacterium]